MLRPKLKMGTSKKLRMFMGFFKSKSRKETDTDTVGTMCRIVNLLVIVSLPNYIFSLIYSIKFYMVQRNSVRNNDRNYRDYTLAVSCVVVFVKQCFSKCGPWTDSISMWELIKNVIPWAPHRVTESATLGTGLRNSHFYTPSR